jgi:hypothetical protein
MNQPEPKKSLEQTQWELAPLVETQIARDPRADDAVSVETIKIVRAIPA